MLKLTTDKHEASRGLSATAELLVMLALTIRPKYFTDRGSSVYKLVSLDIRKLAKVGNYLIVVRNRSCRLVGTRGFA